MEDGAEFVEVVGAFVEDAEVEVNFGWGAEVEAEWHLIKWPTWTSAAGRRPALLVVD